MQVRGKQHEKGQSLVEFALALPILILILSGLVDTGRVFFAYIFLEEAAAEAALYVSIHPDCVTDNGLPECAPPNNAEWRAQNSGSTQGIVLRNTINITATTNSGTNPAVGDTVTVTARMAFSFITPGMSALMEYSNNERGNGHGDILMMSIDASHVVITE